MKSNKPVTHTGMRCKYHNGVKVSESRVMLRELAKTYEESVSGTRYSKLTRCVRPCSPWVTLRLENVQRIDDYQCAQHDKDVAVQQHSEEL